MLFVASIFNSGHSRSTHCHPKRHEGWDLIDAAGVLSHSDVMIGYEGTVCVWMRLVYLQCICIWYLLLYKYQFFLQQK